MTDDEETITRLCIAYNSIYCEQPEEAKNLPEVMRRAILPIIKAERIRGGEMVKEAAAKHCDQWSSQYREAHKNAQARKQRQEARDFESMAMASAFRAFEIRALSVPAIVEAGDA